MVTNMQDGGFVMEPRLENNTGAVPGRELSQDYGYMLEKGIIEQPRGLGTAMSLYHHISGAEKCCC